jgi:hypothetical protein
MALNKKGFSAIEIANKVEEKFNNVVGFLLAEIEKINPTQEWLLENKYQVPQNFDSKYFYKEREDRSDANSPEHIVGKNITFCLKRDRGQLLPDEVLIENDLLKRKQKQGGVLTSANDIYLENYLNLVKTTGFKKLLSFPIKPSFRTTTDNPNKSQKIDAFGNTKWIEDSKMEDPNNYNEYFSSTKARKALFGEEDLVNFLMKVLESKKTDECYIDPIEEIVKKSATKQLVVSDLDIIVTWLSKNLIEADKTRKPCVGVLTYRNKTNSDFLDVFTKGFVAPSCIFNPYLMDSKSNGRYGFNAFIRKATLGYKEYTAIPNMAGFKQSEKFVYYITAKEQKIEVTAKKPAPAGTYPINAEKPTFEELLLNTFNPAEKVNQIIADPNKVVQEMKPNKFEGLDDNETSNWGTMLVAD